MHQNWTFEKGNTQIRMNKTGLRFALTLDCYNNISYVISDIAPL